MDNTSGDATANGPPRALGIDQESVNGAVVVRVRGEVDVATAGQLDGRLREAEAVVPRHAPLVVDLTGVTFLGSAGMALLMRHRDRCATQGSTLWLVATNREVLRPIQLAGLAEVLVTLATVDDALGQ